MKKYNVTFLHINGSTRTVQIEALNIERAALRFTVNWGTDMEILKVTPITL